MDEGSAAGLRSYRVARWFTSNHSMQAFALVIVVHDTAPRSCTIAVSEANYSLRARCVR
jgi:hypothetical protein